MALLSKEAILSLSDLTHEDVDVPEWGGTVRIREMTADQRDAYELELSRVKEKGQEEPTSVRASLVARCAVDEAGAVLFSPADVDALGQKSAVALTRLFRVAVRLNAIGTEAKEHEKKS